MTQQEKLEKVRAKRISVTDDKPIGGRRYQGVQVEVTGEQLVAVYEAVARGEQPTNASCGGPAGGTRTFDRVMQTLRKADLIAWDRLMRRWVAVGST